MIYAYYALYVIGYFVFAFILGAFIGRIIKNGGSTSD